MTSVIHIQNLRKSYDQVHAVAGIDLEVRRGEIFGVLGPNGAGKTTAVECLAGLRDADSGTVEVLGIDPQRHPEKVREVLGVQLQESVLPAKLTVAEAMRLYSSFYRDPADAEELLQLLNLTQQRATAYTALSGGQKQRLSIALALIGNPQIAILDELTTGLDPQSRRDTWALIEKIRDRGVTIVLVTHFMEEAERLCDRLVIIDGGHVVAEGSPSELIAGLDDRRTFRMRTAEPVDEQVLYDLADVDQVRKVGPELEITGSRRVLPAVLLALAESDIVPEEIRTISRSLDDVFVDVTGRAIDDIETYEEVAA